MFRRPRRVIAVLLGGVGLLVGVSLVMFLALAALPGDAASQSLGLRGTSVALAEQRSAWGLDRPAPVRWLEWWGGVVRGDLGADLATGRPVVDIVAGPLARSAVLAAIALAGAIVAGFGAGLLAGWRSDTRTDRGVSAAALIAVSAPEFVVAVGLTALFAVRLGWLPAVSLLPIGGSLGDRPQVLVLPALTLTVVAGSALARLVRPLVRAQAASAHVEAATLAGLSTMTVMTRHLLPGLLPPAGALVALTVPYLLGGAVVVETVFGYPGLGSLLVQAVSQREPAVTMTVGSVLVVCALLAWGAADLLHRADRRRLGGTVVA